MIRDSLRAGVAAALVAAACVQAPRPAPPGGASERLELLDQAFASARHDPVLAARLFAQAGPGATLERVRLEAWLSALERSGAGERDWRGMADEDLPDDLDGRVALGLARALAADGHSAAAAEVLEGAPPNDRVAADLELMSLGDGNWREPAARRLAVAAPHRLRRVAPRDDDAALRGLGRVDRLERAAAWRLAGSPGRGAAELGSLRFSGDEERRRRHELARCEIAGGNPRRAISALHDVPVADPEAHLLRGEAYRRQGWQRFPHPSARASFDSCVDSARRGLEVSGGDASLARRSLRLVVECGTEAGRLDEALSAWWRAEALGWSDGPRDWLGRRLGIAVARRGGDPRSLVLLASSMPEHERCLRFWAALASPDRERELRALAGAKFSDVYGLWARAMTGEPAPDGVVLGPPVDPGPVPGPVAWLVDRGELDVAAAEWRRIRTLRGSWPAEGLAEAALADLRERPMDAIGALRAAIPELGTVAMDGAPVNAVRAYLPLRWPAALRASAAEFGVDPWLLAGVARQESAFTAHARSPRGALGVLQLLEGTARGHSRALGLGTSPDLRNPELNIRIGARELARLVERFGAVEPALAAYNAGETRARSWWRREPDRYRFTESVPILETYNYIRRVSYLAEAYRLVWSEEWRRTP